MKIIGLIPARGGSKGILNKNIVALNSKPLIEYSISAGLDSDYIDAIYVSSDSKRILTVAEGCGAKALLRPAELATDVTTTDAVIAQILSLDHFKSFIEENGLIVLLQPTSPLRTTQHIDEAIELILKQDEDVSLISVCRPTEHPAKSFAVDDAGYLTSLYGADAPFTPRQKLPEAYMPNGAIYIFRAKSFLENSCIPRTKIIPYLMKESESTDIDTREDLERVETTMTPFQIGGRIISADHPPLVIAEIGINHGGSLAQAKKLVLAAKEAGAEIVKFQSHVIDDEMSGHAKAVIPGNADISIYEIMASCTLSDDEERELKAFVEKQDLLFLSTPFSRAAADRLESMGVKAYKIGSGECNNYPLIDHIAAFGKPIILSTGMNDIEAVAKAVKIFTKHKVPYALLHCTNVYPTPPEAVRLGGMIELQKAFPDAQIGLSDHTTGNYACLGAVALGATIVERHFTDDMKRDGPDVICSMDPKAMRELIEGCTLLQKMRGGKKELADIEVVTADFAFASVVTIQPIKAGEKFSKSNLWVKRPGTGDFLAEDYDQLLGQTANHDLPIDYQICKGDFTK